MGYKISEYPSGTPPINDTDLFDVTEGDINMESRKMHFSSFKTIVNPNIGIKLVHHALIGSNNVTNINPANDEVLLGTEYIADDNTPLLIQSQTIFDMTVVGVPPIDNYVRMRVLINGTAIEGDIISGYNVYSTAGINGYISFVQNSVVANDVIDIGFYKESNDIDVIVREAQLYIYKIIS